MGMCIGVSFVIVVEVGAAVLALVLLGAVIYGLFLLVERVVSAR